MVTIIEATAADFVDLMKVAKEFDLDCELADASQFTVAKRENKILAFGRIIKHDGFSELATIGVVIEFQKMGIGSILVNNMTSKTKDELFLVTVLPDFFSRLGFKTVKEYSPVFTKKINFCKDFHFEDEEIKVMKFSKV